MLEIESIETTPIRVPLKRTYRGSYYRMPNRCTIVTKVTTVDGVVGEIYNADTDGHEQVEILEIIEREIKPVITGMSILNHQRIWEAMNVVTRDQLRDRRLAMQAMACIDSAVWDAIGTYLNQPLYRLWGGFRNAVPMIGIGGYYEEPGFPSIEEEIEAFLGHGMVGMKFKIGRSPEVDAQRLARAVRAAPEGWTFIVDANQGYSAREAIEFLRLVSGLVQLRWFEEPCRWPGDRIGMRDVRLMGTPIAAGQTEISHVGMHDLLSAGAIDVSNFDASWGGGPTEWLRVAATARVFGAQLGHHEEAHIASHLLASQPHGTYVEAFHVDRDPIFWHMLTNRPTIKDGMFSLPDMPGFGWDLDWDFIEGHRVDL